MLPSCEARKKKAPRTAIGRLLAEPTVLDQMIQLLDQETAAAKAPRVRAKDDDPYV
jgi:hypothetical protein